MTQSPDYHSPGTYSSWCRDSPFRMMPHALLSSHLVNSLDFFPPAPAYSFASVKAMYVTSHTA